jgi:hypothetical protein
LGFRRRTAKSAALSPPPPCAVLSELEAGQKNTFLWRFCVSQQGEFKNTTKTFLEKVRDKNFLPKS